MENNYITCSEELGSINISEEVITGLILNAVKGIEGVAGLANSAGTEFAELLGIKTAGKGIKVQIVEKKIVTDIIVLIKYGFNIMDVAKTIQNIVADSIVSATGITDAEVNVHISGISFDR